MIDKELLDILVCPKDQVPLALADESLLAKVNEAIAAGQVENLGGRTIDEPLQAGLVRQDKVLLYPIVDDIPVLLADEAIPLQQFA
ncbi:MAG TPA: Trm112 family protein [Thermoguttaceae bacterium]|nr:Trm112 family protein [Thermoguttaceae bacterium]